MHWVMKRWTWTFLTRLQNHPIHIVHMPLPNDLCMMTFHCQNVSPRQSSCIGENKCKYTNMMNMWWNMTYEICDTWQFPKIHLLVVFCGCPQHAPKPYLFRDSLNGPESNCWPNHVLLVEKHLRSKGFLFTKQQSLLVTVCYFWVVNDSKSHDICDCKP